MVGLHSLKLTWPLKIGHPKRKLVFQPSIFRGYVSFRDCICLNGPSMFTSKDVFSSSCHNICVYCVCVCVLDCIADMKKRKTSRTLVKRSNDPDAGSEREQILLEWLWLEIWVCIRYPFEINVDPVPLIMFDNETKPK